MKQLTMLPQAAVIWGQGVLADAASRLCDWAVEKPIVFTNQQLADVGRDLLWPHLDRCLGHFMDLPAHAPDFAIQQALEAAIACDAHSIVAHGGGSVLDAAKAVSFLHHKATGRYLPIAAFPTTLSGSEFSHYFGITETVGPQPFKRSYAVRETVPAVAVLDPALLLDTPRQLLLASAIKSIDHAVEGMRQISLEHPHAIMAADGVARFFKVLERWPQEIETRAAVAAGLVDMSDLLELQLAAWHCYFSPASVIYGLSHRIGHILGGTFGLPHSVTSCIALAPVIRACTSFYGERLTAFVPRASGPEAGLILANRIASLVTELDLPERISTFGLSRDRLADLAALLQANYPKEVADLGEDAETKLGRLLETLW